MVVVVVGIGVVVVRVVVVGVVAVVVVVVVVVAAVVVVVVMVAGQSVPSAAASHRRTGGEQAHAHFHRTQTIKQNCLVFDIEMVNPVVKRYETVFVLNINLVWMLTLVCFR